MRGTFACIATMPVMNWFRRTPNGYERAITRKDVDLDNPPHLDWQPVDDVPQLAKSILDEAAAGAG